MRPALTAGGPPLGGERRRLAAALALTVVLHAALLLQPSAGSNRAAPGALPVVSVRMLPTTEAVVAVASEAVSPPAEAVPERSAIPAAAAPVAPAGHRTTAAATASAAPTDATTPSTATSPSHPQPTVDAREAAPAPAYPALPAAPGYALSGRLDPGPRPLDDIVPDYPDGTHSRSGSVVVRILVAADGTLDDVAVVQATPPGLFDQAALEAIRRARFAPGQLFGTPVKSQITIEIGFAEVNRGSAVSGRGY